jgi:hypothetical protein
MSDQPTADAPDASTAPDGAEAPSATAAPASEAPTRGPISRRRRWALNGVIVLATVLSLFTMVSVWANRLLFNPDNWESTSRQLIQNPDIRSATANFVADRLYAKVDVKGRLQAALPPRLQPLAAPVASAVHDGTVRALNTVLERPRFQSIWAKANRKADQLFIAIVDGGKGPVAVSGGVVTLDLTSLVDTAASRLGLPSSVTSKLPSNIGTLTVFRSSQLSFVQDLGNAIRRLALLFSILVPALWALVIGLARGRRRRTLMSVGFSMVVAGVLGVVGRQILQTAIVNTLVHHDAQRPAVRATLAIGTEILAEIAVAFIIVGIVAVVAAWFAGPARVAVPGRRAIAPFLRERPVWTYAIVVVVLVLLFIWQPIHAMSTVVGIVVFSCLALLGTELLRRQTAAEFPDAQLGDATAAIRRRVDALRGRSEGVATGPSADSLSEQLERLAALRDRGALTTEDYDTAKATLLHA